MPLLLQGGADGAVLVERARQLRGANLREPRAAVRDQRRRDRVREREPAPSVARRRLALGEERALVLLLPLRELRDIDERGAVELRPVVEHLDDVGSGTG